MAKILSIVSYTFLPFSSGGQKLIAQFNEFLGQKAELTVIGTANNDVLLAKNYTLLPWMKIGMAKFFDVGIFFRLKKYIQNNKIEYVLLEHPYMGWLGLLLAKTCAKPLVIHTHNIEFERFRSIGKKWWFIVKIYEIFVLRSADVVFCISEEDRQYMKERLGLPPL
jgi:hypothetical protein